MTTHKDSSDFVLLLHASWTQLFCLIYKKLVLPVSFTGSICWANSQLVLENSVSYVSVLLHCELTISLELTQNFMKCVQHNTTSQLLIKWQLQCQSQLELQTVYPTKLWYASLLIDAIWLWKKILFKVSFCTVTALQLSYSTVSKLEFYCTV